MHPIARPVLAFCAAALFTAPAAAGTILAPVSATLTGASYSSGSSGSGGIDQSGMSVGYTSGLTDFATYVAGATHESTATDWTHGTLIEAGSGFTITYDLGNLYSLSGFALWNYYTSHPSSLRSFSLIGSASGDFTDAVTLLSGASGALTVATTGSAIPAQIYSFTAATVQYVQLTATSNFGYYRTALGEVAFDGAALTAEAPLPAGAALLPAALGLLALRRRRG